MIENHEYKTTDLFVSVKSFNVNTKTQNPINNLYYRKYSVQKVVINQVDLIFSQLTKALCGPY